MAGLDPAIHAFVAAKWARQNPGQKK